MEEIVRLQQLHIHQLQSQVDKMGKLILKRAGANKPSSVVGSVSNCTAVEHLSSGGLPETIQPSSNSNSSNSNNNSSKSNSISNSDNNNNSSSSNNNNNRKKAPAPSLDDNFSRNKVIVEAARRAAARSNESTTRSNDDWDSDSSGWSDTSWGASSSGGGKSPQMPKVIDLFTRKFSLAAEDGSASD
jgi:hypothetical protein